MVSTDLHGNFDDFLALRARFTALLTEEPEGCWVLCGDLVHGPAPDARQVDASLYGYEDDSGRLVREVTALRAEHPGRVHVLLGNHDHGHVGGPHTAKFYPDEVEALERVLSAPDRRALHHLFGEALLAVAVPSGALLCHGSPDDRLERLEDLDALHLLPAANDGYGRHVLATLLRSYGQPEATTARLLSKLSRSLPFPLTFVAHGHDRDERGFFVEGPNQICPVLFGAPREQRRYLLLDARTRYEDATALREGVEILRVHG